MAPSWHLADLEMRFAQVFMKNSTFVGVVFFVVFCFALVCFVLF